MTKCYHQKRSPGKEERCSGSLLVQTKKKGGKEKKLNPSGTMEGENLRASVCHPLQKSLRVGGTGNSACTSAGIGKERGRKVPEEGKGAGSRGERVPSLSKHDWQI